jgi:rubredoxin
VDLALPTAFQSTEAPSLKEVLINIFPTNPVAAMAEGNMLQIIVFSLLFGIALKKWECIVCGLIYVEEEGWPDDGIEPGTKWEDVPEDWICPDCGVGKEDFEMVEID